jgi:predicted regulator of Ras-like GTPase activity (Roadblock/LC7/MglB family)
MGFRENLARAVDEVQGAILCTLMGQDGIPVDSFESAEGTADRDVTSTTVELSALLKQAQQSASGLRTGKLKELIIEGDELTAIVRPVTDEYFVALLLLPGGNLGKGRYLLRVIAPRLLAELA